MYARARKCMFCLEKCWIVANVFNIKMKTTLTELQFLDVGDDIISFVCPNNNYFLTTTFSPFPYINSICSLLFPPALFVFSTDFEYQIFKAPFLYVLPKFHFLVLSTNAPFLFHSFSKLTHGSNDPSIVFRTSSCTYVYLKTFYLDDIYAGVFFTRLWNIYKRIEE